MRVLPHKYGESILLAVSGGVDSMVMASLFVGSGFYKRIAIAHCNFHLRGEESDADEALVREWAESRSIRCFVSDFDTRSFAEERGISIEMAARELRYRWFDRICKEEGFPGVCVAHNADDNAETLFLNLLRGTGMRGVCAMAEISPNPFGETKVFRPILGYSREEIMDFASSHGVPFRTDSTNLENDFKRNKLRNQVFPLLKEINPSLIRTLGRDIENFNDASAIVDEYVQSSGVQGLRELPLNKLKSSPHRRYLLYSFMEGYGFNSSVVKELSDLLESDRIVSGKIFESENFTLVTTSSSLIVEGKDAVPDAPQFKIECLEWSAEMPAKTPRGVVLLDADALGQWPRVRRWKEGDWLRPIGLEGKKKVSDMLTDLKYDISRKRGALVVEGEGSHVLALVGERIDRDVRVTPSTRKVYRISIL